MILQLIHSSVGLVGKQKFRTYFVRIRLELCPFGIMSRLQEYMGLVKSVTLYCWLNSNYVGLLA